MSKQTWRVSALLLSIGLAALFHFGFGQDSSPPFASEAQAETGAPEAKRRTQVRDENDTRASVSATRAEAVQTTAPQGETGMAFAAVLDLAWPGRAGMRTPLPCAPGPIPGLPKRFGS